MQQVLKVFKAKRVLRALLVLLVVLVHKDRLALPGPLVPQGLQAVRVSRGQRARQVLQARKALPDQQVQLEPPVQPVLTQPSLDQQDRPAHKVK